MKNKELQAVAETRDITFDDILMVIDKDFEARVRKVVAKSNYTKEDVVKKLDAAKCKAIREIFAPGISGDCFVLMFEAALAPGKVKGLAGRWSRNVMIRIQNKTLTGVHCAGGTLDFGTGGESLEIDLFRSLYVVYPEAFDPSGYCI